MQAGDKLRVQLHDCFDRREFACRIGGDDDVFYFADSDALELHFSALFETGGVFEVRVDDQFLAEHAHARGFGHEEEQRRQQRHRHQHNHSNLELRPLYFLLTRHSRSSEYLARRGQRPDRYVWSLSYQRALGFLDANRLRGDAEYDAPGDSDQRIEDCFLPRNAVPLRSTLYPLLTVFTHCLPRPRPPSTSVASG